MAQPHGERYSRLKLLIGLGSVAGVMLTWLGFARSSDARIEAWQLAQSTEATATAAVQLTPAVEASSTAAGSTPAAAETATATPSTAGGSFADSWPTPRSRTSRGS